MAFIWRVSRGGYSWADQLPGLILTSRLNQRGDREYAPLEQYTGLFLSFSTIEPSQDAIRAFANEYGLLGLGWMVSCSILPDEQFDIWENQINAMRNCVERWNGIRKRQRGKRDKSDLCESVNQHLQKSFWSAYVGLPTRNDEPSGVLQLRLATPSSLPSPAWIHFNDASRENKVALETRPSNLLNALWLQFASAIAEDTQFRQCLSCGSWFAISPEGRRADAQYCKDACRIRAYKERKRIARELHAAGTSLKKIANQLGTSIEIVRGWIAEMENL